MHTACCPRGVAGGVDRQLGLPGVLASHVVGCIERVGRMLVEVGAEEEIHDGPGGSKPQQVVGVRVSVLHWVL